MTRETRDPRTLAIHAGTAADPVTGAIAPNIAMSTTFAYEPGSIGFSATDSEDLTAKPYCYSRWTNPTVRQLERRIAALEQAEEALALSTGMAAAAALFFTVLRTGDHFIVSDVCYPGVRELADGILAGLGVEVTAVNLSLIEDLRGALRPNTKLIHAETPCNPLLRLTDLRALVPIARERGIAVSVDSTLATPVATRPFELGVDYVIHSLTKYINGHGDVLGGAIVGRKADIERIRASAGVHLGATLCAHSAWLILRGAETLFPRMEACSRSAQRIAEFLGAHRAVLQVNYPGLSSHPQHELARRQMHAHGGVIAFQTRDPHRVAKQMAAGFKVIHYAVSLGHQRSNIVLLPTDEMMRSTYHLEGPQLEDYRRYAGEGIFRLSAGLEAVEDLIADLAEVLDAQP